MSVNVPNSDVFTSKMDGKGRVTVPKNLREQWRLDAGDRVEVAVVGAESSGYNCDECGGEFDLPEVLVLGGGDRVVCADCSGVEDRIVGP